MDLYQWIKEYPNIEMDEQQAKTLSECLEVNGHSIEISGDSLFLNCVDQTGEISKKVTIDQVIALAANLKYKETEKIMDSLDEITTISIENIKTYCENLVDLIDREKELHSLENALVQTEHFLDIKNMVEDRPKKIAR